MRLTSLHERFKHTRYNQWGGGVLGNETSTSAQMDRQVDFEHVKNRLGIQPRGYRSKVSETRGEMTGAVGRD